MNLIITCFLIVTLFIIIPLQSYAFSPLYSFRRLNEQTHVSPSPSPSGGSNYQQACSGRVSRSCQMKNVTACLSYSQSEMWLFVYNNGENPQLAKIVILPANNTIKGLNISSHQMEKVNLSSDVDLSSAIMLTTSDGDCVISTAAAPPPENHYQKYPYNRTYITNGAYIVILLLIVGGTLTFFKLRTRGRHLDGVQYHELEMGNSTALNMEENETENWDQDWGDQWDDEKHVKSSSDNHVGVVVKVKQANGLVTKLPISNGKKKEWDD